MPAGQFALPERRSWSYYSRDAGSSRMTPRKQIFSLGFGNAHAVEFDDPDKMADALATSTRATLNYRSLAPEQPFLCRSSMVRTGLVRVVASASSAVEVDAYAPSAIGVLLLPIHGTTQVDYGRRTMEWGTSAGPVFLPADRCVCRATARSVVGIDIDPMVTERVLRAMLGDVAERNITGAIDHTTPRLLPRGGGREQGFADYMLRLIASFDALGCDSRLIERSGLDDTLLRSAILYLSPELLTAGTEHLERKASTVDLVCDYIEANLSLRITLTDLERISGLSARRLQYAFRAQFNRSPMQWVTERRLEAVRKRILSAPEGATVTWIAGDYFGNLGEFSRLYRERFGEMPSETLKTVASRRAR